MLYSLSNYRQNPTDKMNSSITYNKAYVQLIQNAIRFSQHKMIESRESFINVINSILLFDSETNAETSRSYDNIIHFVFAHCCSNYPNIAIFMVKHNMCTKEAFFSCYDGRTPLKNIFIRNYEVLLNCFIEKLEFFDELLVQSDDQHCLPLLYLHERDSNIRMLNCVFNSKHCTTEVLGKVCESSNKNVLQCWISNNREKLVKTLLESEKCTTDFVVSSYSNNDHYGFVYNGKMLKLMLESGKLPLDYFDEKIFNVIRCDWINTFLDSQYSNGKIIEKYFSNKTIRQVIICKILSHPKYSYLREIYNDDGTVKSVSVLAPVSAPASISTHGQKNMMEDQTDTDTVRQLKLENETLQLQVAQFKLENKILQLQITKCELEKQFASLEK